MGLAEAVVAVPMIALAVYVGWVILQALAKSSPGFMGVAIILMIAIVLAAVSAIAKELS